MNRPFVLGICVACVAITSSCGASPSRQSSSTGANGKIAAGAGHTCALTKAGGVKCWGFNESGQLGDGTTTDQHTPVAVSDLAGGVIALGAGSDHSCALRSSGGVTCWGWNELGQLGDGTKTDRHRPVEVSGLAGGVIAIAAGGTHSCALTAARTVKCWGGNDSGQLGDGRACGTVCLTPVSVSGLERGVGAIAAGGRHTCALTRTGGVMCWGSNCCAQRGDGTRTRRNTPVPVSGLARGVTAITAGENHTCALTSAGEVKCWGWNKFGQLGDGTRVTRDRPVTVSSLSGDVTSLEAGGTHTCALTSGGRVLCWGANDVGQLGNRGTATRPTPVAVSGLAGGVAAITAWNQTCATMNGGELECWGYNYDGEVGDGTDTDRHAPVGVIGFQ